MIIYMTRYNMFYYSLYSQICFLLVVMRNLIYKYKAHHECPLLFKCIILHVLLRLIKIIHLFECLALFVLITFLTSSICITAFLFWCKFKDQSSSRASTIWMKCDGWCSPRRKKNKLTRRTNKKFGKLKAGIHDSFTSTSVRL